MQGKFTKKEYAILHDAIHIADLHNMEDHEQGVAINFGKKKTYVKYHSDDVWKILNKIVKKMKGEK